MPEAAMHEDRYARVLQGNIWASNDPLSSLSMMS
jgi:hypothetical protein